MRDVGRRYGGPDVRPAPTTPGRSRPARHRGGPGGRPGRRAAPANLFGPDVEPVEAYVAEDRVQAHFLAGELTSLGIPAVADSHEPNETLGGLGELPRVWVRAEDLDKAREWLAGYEAAQRETHPAADE